MAEEEQAGNRGREVSWLRYHSDPSGGTQAGNARYGYGGRVWRSASSDAHTHPQRNAHPYLQTFLGRHERLFFAGLKITAVDADYFSPLLCWSRYTSSRTHTTRIVTPVLLQVSYDKLLVGARHILSPIVQPATSPPIFLRGRNEILATHRNGSRVKRVSSCETPTLECWGPGQQRLNSAHPDPRQT